jgi:hypothetical protein
MFRSSSSRGLKAVVVGALLAVVAMIAAPAQAAVSSVVLQDSGGTAYGAGAHPVALTDRGPGTISATFLGSTYPCAGANATGNIHTSAASVSNPYLTFTSVSVLNCSGVMFSTINVSLKAGCSLKVRVDPTTQASAAGLTDTAITGKVNANDASGNPCLRANGGALCQMDVGGETNATYNEVTQQLTISGSGFSASNATGICAFVNGASISLNVAFDITPGSNPDDAINFRP